METTELPLVALTRRYAPTSEVPSEVCSGTVRVAEVAPGMSENAESSVDLLAAHCHWKWTTSMEEAWV